MAPSSAIRRYAAARSATSRPGPKRPTSQGVVGTATTVTSTPIRTASHSPSTPCASASRVRPAPTWRATDAVVP